VGLGGKEKLEDEYLPKIKREKDDFLIFLK
jgi:hypothetical protein